MCEMAKAEEEEGKVSPIGLSSEVAKAKFELWTVLNVYDFVSLTLVRCVSRCMWIDVTQSVTFGFDFYFSLYPLSLSLLLCLLSIFNISLSPKESTVRSLVSLCSLRRKVLHVFVHPKSLTHLRVSFIPFCSAHFLARALPSSSSVSCSSATLSSPLSSSPCIVHSWNCFLSWAACVWWARVKKEKEKGKSKREKRVHSVLQFENGNWKITRSKSTPRATWDIVLPVQLVCLAWQ